jgi:hypothetical protein
MPLPSFSPLLRIDSLSLRERAGVRADGLATGRVMVEAAALTLALSRARERGQRGRCR